MPLQPTRSKLVDALGNPLNPHSSESMMLGNTNGNGNGSRWSSSDTHRPASFVEKFVQGTNRGNRDEAFNVRGAAPNFAQYPLPHVLTFQGLYGTFSRVYRPSDEALKDSAENARFMRNDPGVMECVEARQRMSALLDWTLEPEDEESQDQKDLCDELTKILQRINRFTEYRYNLMHAIWYGRYAIQHRYRWVKIGDRMRVLPARYRDNPGWLPINGDKLVFRYDDGRPASKADQVGIRVGARFQAADRINGRWNVEPTDRGLAYFLEDWERPLLAIHKHMIEDAAYEDGLDAGTIHGVGIRSRIYWDWFQKQEAMAFLMEYLERSAGGIEIWYYPSGNAEAESKTREAAQNRVGNNRNVVLVPKPMGEDAHAFGVEIVEPGMAGIDALERILTEYFGHRIKRYILGQTLSSEAASTGLGSGVADLHLDTLLQIIKYDATNLEESITNELVIPVKDWNFPHARDINVRFKILTESPDVDAKLKSWQMAFEMGVKFREQEIRDLVGATTPAEEDEVVQSPAFTQQGAGMGGAAGAPGEQGQLGNGQTSVPVAPPNPEADTEAILQKLFGSPEKTGGAVSYVAENGKWVKRELSDAKLKRITSDREHASTTGTYAAASDVVDVGKPMPLGNFEDLQSVQGIGRVLKLPILEGKKHSKWNERDHPRDDDGQFGSGGGGGTATKSGPRRLAKDEKASTVLKDIAKGDRVAFEAGGNEPYEVVSITKRTRKDSIPHDTDPTSLEEGERQTLIVSVKGMNSWGQTAIFTFREVISETKPGATAAKHAKGFEESEHPRADDGRFGDKPGEKKPGKVRGFLAKLAGVEDVFPDQGKWQRQHGRAIDKFKAATERGVSGGVISPDQAEKFSKVADTVLDYMGLKAIERFNSNVENIRVYNSELEMMEDVFTADKFKDLRERGKIVGGVWDFEPGFPNGTLHLDGAHDGSSLTTREIYAHEFGHAVDGAPRGDIGGRISDSRQWRAAYAAEIDRDDEPLTKYARQKPSEGFAEFARLAWSQPRYARETFPECWKIFKSQGLV